jgi:DNA-binding IclR family transcriptional regulator
MSGLDRGLLLLERLAQWGERSFTELQKALPEVPKASLVRLLNQLVDSGHVTKRDGRYRCGDRLGIFACLRAPKRHDDLIERWAGPMDDLASRFGVTALLLERVGDLVVCIHRSLADYAPSMQAVGFRNHQLEHVWMQMLLAAEPALRPRAFAQRPDIEASVLCWAEQGYADDGCSFRPDMRRLAFPIRAVDGSCAAVLGIGGSPHQLSETELPTIVGHVRRLLRELI